MTMRILIAFLVAVAAYGNECATTSTTFSTATWTNCGLGTPGAGDTIKINAASAFTFDANATVGKSLPSTPTGNITASVTGGGATGGSLQAGAYRVKVGYTSPNGTAMSPVESAQFTVSATNIPRITFPAAPAGATGVSIYLTAAAGGSGTETLYGGCASGIPSGLVTACTSTTADLGSAQSAGAAMPQYGAINSTQSLVISPNVTVVVRGDLVTTDNKTLTLSGGSVLEFDASAAPTPASTNYLLETGSNGFATNTSTGIFTTSRS